MRKRVIAIMLAMSMTFTFSACGASEDSSSETAQEDSALARRQKSARERQDVPYHNALVRSSGAKVDGLANFFVEGSSAKPKLMGG